MRKDELKNLMEGALEKAKTLLLRDGKLVPVAFILHGENIDIIGLTFKDNSEKTLQLAYLRKLCKEKKADAVYFLSESWYVTCDKKDLSIEPAKHPMRKECIFIIGECEDGNITLVQLFENKNGEIIFGEKFDLDKVESLKLDFGISKIQEKRSKYN